MSQKNYILTKALHEFQLVKIFFLCYIRIMMNIKKMHKAPQGSPLGPSIPNYFPSEYFYHTFFCCLLGTTCTKARLTPLILSPLPGLIPSSQSLQIPSSPYLGKPKKIPFFRGPPQKGGGGVKVKAGPRNHATFSIQIDVRN